VRRAVGRPFRKFGRQEVQSNELRNILFIFFSSCQMSHDRWTARSLELRCGIDIARQLATQKEMQSAGGIDKGFREKTPGEELHRACSQQVCG
jgi:hypothetical protein